MSNINKRATELLIENGVLVADTLRHLADNEIDSDYFAICHSNENGTEIECELAITDYARQAAGTVDELVKALEAKDAQITNLTAERDALREGEMGEAKHSNTRAAADIYFQLAEECEIPAGGSLVEHVSELRERAEAAEKRIAELERSETQLIDERDNAESALNDAYKAVMGQAPEWSNWFSFADAIDEIELACGLWRNQTEDVIQFRARIAELEEREVTLPPTFWYEHDDLSRDVPVMDARKVKKSIRDAGIRIAAAAGKGE